MTGFQWDELSLLSLMAIYTCLTPVEAFVHKRISRQTHRLLDGRHASELCQRRFLLCMRTGPRKQIPLKSPLNALWVYYLTYQPPLASLWQSRETFLQTGDWWRLEYMYSVPQEFLQHKTAQHDCRLKWLHEEPLRQRTLKSIAKILYDIEPSRHRNDLWVGDITENMFHVRNNITFLMLLLSMLPTILCIGVQSWHWGHLFMILLILWAIATRFHFPELAPQFFGVLVIYPICYLLGQAQPVSWPTTILTMVFTIISLLLFSLHDVRLLRWLFRRGVDIAGFCHGFSRLAAHHDDRQQLKILSQHRHVAAEAYAALHILAPFGIQTNWRSCTGDCIVFGIPCPNRIEFQCHKPK